MENIDILFLKWYYNKVLGKLKAVLSGIAHVKNERKIMKKFLSSILCSCMLLTCVPVQAMAKTEDVTPKDSLAQVVTSTNVKENDVASVTPRNIDYVQLNGTNTYYGTFYVNRGDNVKIHMYIDYYNGLLMPIRIHFNKRGATSKVVATWTGTGHKYADLYLNCQEPGEYTVWLEGNFSGSGAVYREP